MSIAEGLLAALGAIAVVLYILVWMLQVWFMAEVRRTEAQAWRVLAKPGWLRVYSFESLAFFWKGTYHRLRSKKLRRFGATLRWLQSVGLLTFLGSVLWVLLFVWLAA